MAPPVRHPGKGMAMRQRAAAAPVEILLVEDSAADIAMLKQALETADFAHRLHVVREGEQVISFLRGTGRFAGAPRPDLVLLDVKLPGLNGFAVLAVIRGQPQLEHTMVVVLTGSDLEEYRKRSRDLAADLYVVKPAGINGYVTELKRIRGLMLAK